jgi:hypothetical protein
MVSLKSLYLCVQLSYLILCDQEFMLTGVRRELKGFDLGPQSLVVSMDLVDVLLIGSLLTLNIDQVSR